MKRIVVSIPHSHAWFWLQTCVVSLLRNPPVADKCEVIIVVVDNSLWSPAIKGVTETSLLEAKPPSIRFDVIPNHKTNKFHASALDCVVEKYQFDYLMALETDVMALRPTWLQWFVDQMYPTDFAVGMWHHEQFVNPSCTLYRGDILRDMAKWCKTKAPQNELRWGPAFSKTGPLDVNHSPGDPALEDMKGWISGPFAEKRGWPKDTILKEQPSGQLKGPGWYEPGQQLHHWAVEVGCTYAVCPTVTTFREPGMPLQTLYGSIAPVHVPQRQLEANELFGNSETVHLWGGTRALDILKHPVTCQFVKANTPGWLAREARFWRQTVPSNVQEQTLELIRKWGWYITGQGADYVTDRDKEAAEYVRACYREGGVDY